MSEPTVADANELLEFWTAILRGGQPRARLEADELAQVGLPGRYKAAEMLVKLLGLPAESAAEPPVVVDDIPRAAARAAKTARAAGEADHG